MKIIYENSGVKNYMEDHGSYRRNFCSCEKKAWKNSGLYGIRNLDLCDTGAQSTNWANKPTGSRALN